MKRSKKYIIILIATLFIVALFTGMLYDQFLNKRASITMSPALRDKMHEYLKDNYGKMDLEKDKDFSDIKIDEVDLKNKEIFFTGENHGIKANKKLNMKFLRYFEEKTNFKYYLCELSYSDAYFLNQYLKTGEISILQNLYRSLQGTYEWNKDSFNHWKEVYEFNKALPEDKKLQVVGVDIEHQPNTALAYMNAVLPQQKAPKEIYPLIEELKSIKNEKNSSGLNDRTKEFSAKLQKDLQQKEGIYKDYLGKAFFGFKLVNDNIVNTFDVYKLKGNDFNKLREEKIYQNFMMQYNLLPKGKYYGQWGLNHIFQQEQSEVQWFGARINGKDSGLMGKVLSIPYIYVHCKYMERTSDIRTYFVKDINTYNDQFEAFDDLSKTGCTLFRLTGKGSPFSKELLWMLLDEAPKGKMATTDCFQYIVVIRDSQATEQLGE